MANQKATREGRVLHLPKYKNAEMLMMEFLRNDMVTIQPKDSSGSDFTSIEVFVHIEILDELIEYINNNI